MATKAPARRNGRLRGNACTLAVTITLLFLAVKIADGSFTKRINEISQNLDRALQRMLEIEQTEYTELTVNATYRSSAAYNARGMGGFYNLTGQFIDAVVSKEIFPEGLIYVEDGRIGYHTDDWPSVARHYVGLLTIATFLVLFGFLMPLCGFCFCCCRCCGKCGARSRPFDKKHDLCKKICLATLLISLGTLMLFGVVVAFVSNQQVQDGTEEWPRNMKVSVEDTNTYLTTTNSQIDTLFRKNYGEFKDTLLRILNSTGEIVFQQLADYSNATAMTTMWQIVDGMSDVQTNLTILRNSTNGLRVNASQLNDALRKVKRDLLHTLNNCRTNIPDCATLSNNVINQLGSDIDFNSLPDVTSEIDSLDAVLQDDIKGKVKAGYDNLQSIKTNIDNVVRAQLTEIETKVAEAGRQISDGSDGVTGVITNVTDTIKRTTDEYLDLADDYIARFSPYRYYTSVAISCVLLLVTLCIVLGLICGICGKRPDAYGDDCCNKGSGGRFLMCGVLVMFLATAVLVAAVAVCFTLGIVGQRLVCDSLRSPDESQAVRLADEWLESSGQRLDVNVSYVLSRCHRNESIYNVLRLEKVFDVSKVARYLDEFDIQEALDRLKEEIENNVGTGVTILDDGAQGQLQELATSGIANINYDRFKNVLETNLTTVNLTALSDQLSALIDLIRKQNTPNMEEIITQLSVNILQLQTYQSKLVEPMTASATQMISIAESLEEGLKFNHSSFEAAINDLIAEVKGAEDFLQHHGVTQLTESATMFAEAVKTHIQRYLDRVVDKTVVEVGRCGPLSNVFNATLTFTCDKIVTPLNGFWFGVFWSLLLFLPTIIVSVKLASLYQRYNPYGGHLIETEYLYDAYADHDNIPLNSRGKPKKKQKVIRRDERSGVPGPTGDHEVARDYGGGSRGQDARYADMAPKHWEEFPANGPPQYQRAPTEYERPPPYYYPANGDQPQH